MISARTKLAGLAAIALLVSGCVTSKWTPVRQGKALPLVVGSVTGPGSPWYRGRMGAAPPILDMTSWVTDFATGTYDTVVIAYGRVLTTNVGPIGSGSSPSGENSGNEAIFVYSNLWKQPIPENYFDVAKADARDDFIRLYRLAGVTVTDIEDITSRYEERLSFWRYHMFAFAYRAGEHRYSLLHAFTVIPGPNPDTNVVNDFSYIQMERAGAPDHFDDFIRMLMTYKED